MNEGTTIPHSEIDNLITLTSHMVPGSSSVEPVVANELCKARIIVIDDEPAVTSVVDRCLSLKGFSNVAVFNNPVAGIEEVIRSGGDVLLLDIGLASVDGVSILKHLRARKETQFLPVIMLTSAIDEETRIRALASGANDYVTKPFNESDLIRRIQNALYFKRYAKTVEDQIEAVQRELYTDSLTGMYSRRAFDEHYPELIAKNEPGETGLILFDVDQFKKINDSYGHQAGDYVLRHLAAIIREVVGPSALPARIGGDEFAVVMRSGEPNSLKCKADTIHQMVNRAVVTFEGKSIRYSVSGGVAVLDNVIDDKGKLFKAADAALYQSKRQGRNLVNVYSDAGSLSIGLDHLTYSLKQDDQLNSDCATKSGSILIVDDEPAVTEMLELQLRRADFKNVVTENTAENAVDRVIQLMPDVLILDLRMPRVNGLQILRTIKNDSRTSNIPVLIMTSADDQRVRLAALKLQASDFLVKPTSSSELETRVTNSLKLKLQHNQLVQFSRRLKHEVQVRTNELFATRRETILCLARAAETRDTETGNHVIRVGHYAAIIARQLGMDNDYIGWIELAAQLHDVGKLSIPDAILHKPGKLTAEERKIIETHCEQADRIFFGKSSRVEKATITSPLLKMAARIASTHHERWDGNGYPARLSGKDIPLEGRITAVVDVFDALSTKRHYKDAIDVEQCFQMIVEERGKHFDPMVVDAFLASKVEVIQALRKWQDIFANES